MASTTEMERLFRKAWSMWPTFLTDSHAAAWKAWQTLSTDQRREAAQRAGSYVAWAREAGESICTFGVYLQERRWERLPEPVAEPSVRPTEPPFGPAWMAERLIALFAGPTGPEPRLTKAEAMLVEQGRYTAEQLLAPKRVMTGYPAVNAMDEYAERRRGIPVSQMARDLVGAMEPVPVTSPVFEAWQETYERRGWRWIPDPGAMRVVFFPKGGPDGLDAFEAAIKNKAQCDDGGEREAVE